MKRSEMIPKFLISQTFRLIYKIEPQIDKIKIFGKQFVKENKEKCYLSYKGKIFQLQEYFFLRDLKEEKDKFEILMIQFNNISEKNYIFDEYNLLIKSKNENKKPKTNTNEKKTKEEEIEENENLEEQYLFFQRHTLGESFYNYNNFKNKKEKIFRYEDFSSDKKAFGIFI